MESCGGFGDDIIRLERWLLLEPTGETEVASLSTAKMRARISVRTSWSWTLATSFKKTVLFPPSARPVCMRLSEGMLSIWA